MHRFQNRKKKEADQALTEPQDKAKYKDPEREETSLREYIMGLEERIRGDILDEARRMNESTARSMAEQIKRLDDELRQKTENQKAEENREIALLEKTLQEAQAELSTLRTQNQTLAKESRQLEGELQEKSKQQARAEDALMSVQKDLDRIREHNKMLGEQNTELEAELQKERKKYQSDMRSWKQAEEEIGRLEEGKRKAEEDICIVRKDIQDLAEQNTRLKEELDKSIEKQRFQTREWNQLQDKYERAAQEISLIQGQNDQLQIDLAAQKYGARASWDADGETLVHRVAEQMKAVEGMMRQMTADFQADAQERKATEKQSVDWMVERLREAELDNATLRKENEMLTARIAGGQKAMERRTGLEDELKRVREELATVQQKNQDSVQRNKPQIDSPETVENELKKVQDELATVQKQNSYLKNAQLKNEQKETGRRTELHRLRKEFEASKQREKQFQSELEKAQRKHQAEIEKWVREVTSSKDENDALRQLVRQIEEENQNKIVRAQAETWRRERGLGTPKDTPRNVEEPSS